MVKSTRYEEEPRNLGASEEFTLSEEYLPGTDNHSIGEAAGVIAIAVEFESEETLRETTEANISTLYQEVTPELIALLKAQLRVEVEAEVRQELTVEMEKELEQRTLALIAQYEMLIGEIQEQAEDTIRHVRHDLRTPISNILLRSEILERVASDLFKHLPPDHPDRVKLAHHFEVLKSQIGVLKANFGEETFGLQSANIYELRLDTVTSSSISADLLRRFRSSTPLNDKVRIDWAFPPDNTRFIADREKILSIYHILIDNALKFTESGIVRVVLEVRKDHVFIQVGDTGCGIRDELIPHIFEKEVSLSESETPRRPGSEPGTGLGLYFVRRFCDAMDAKVYVHSKRGELEHGTLFTITVPLQSPSTT